ncbi:autotransporter outer membrane beta-barrel domain-containing protein [Sphingomonas sp. HDW15A]|uniref:beta strand repeat-containing protein n=1 Tax=Sphingomonas sp. HDW15A TaxID=2714942 RepID=UPI00140B6F0C|nr:autotransporter outer membrane beta-barrel domain-containing protein [Sphingomonas sp. HDW15A]QIK96489.1 autotransporter outer membrane beta-barrel domain-containing protein [Sphingomonas sp. HDW15A]
MHISTRRALFASAITGATLVVASPAQAACTVTPAGTPVAGTVVCATTTTTDTTYAGVSPAVDRNYNVDTSTTAFTGTVSTGAIVDGYGLAFTNTVGGTNALNVVNNGSISATSPTAGGNGALSISSIGSTVTYSGAGSITNLGAGNGLDVNLSGTATFTGTVGGNVTSGTGIYPSGIGISVDHNGTVGNVAVTTVAGTTIRADYTAIGVVGSNPAYTGNLGVTNNSTIASLTGALGTLDVGIFVNQFGLGSATIVNNGAVGSATDRVAVRGIEAFLSNAASAAPVSVTGTGAISSAGTGIFVFNNGTGTTTVNYTGAVDTTGTRGVDVLGATGATSVTLGAVSAAGDAVVVNSTGSQTVVLNGVTTGTNAGLVSTASAARTITVGTAGNVTGGNVAIQLQGTGATTLNNNGIIGAASTGLALSNTDTGAVTLNNGSATNHTAVLNGRLTLNAGADTVTNAAIWNTQGVTDFGAGADVFNNTTGGVLNILGNTTFAGLETFTQTGRINFSAGTTLTGPAIAFVNGPGSFIDTTGNATIAGFTSMSNSGTIDLAAGTFTVPAGVFTNTTSGVIVADEGATTITGQTSLVNAGVIDLLDGAVGDTLTINSAYSGTGRLQIDVSGTTADLLVINGNVSGQTVVDVNTVGLGVFDPDGIQFVDVTGAFTSAPGSFVIGEESANPLIDFDVEQRGQDFFLVTLLDPENAFVPLAATGLVREMWYQSADEVFANTLAPSDKAGLSVWGNIYGGQRHTGTTNSQTVNGVQYDADNNIELNRFGVQAGVGYGFGLARVGVTVGYENAQGEGDGEFDGKGFNIGLYGQYGGLTGLHAEALFKYDSYDVEFDGLFDGNDVDGDSTGFDIAGGYRFAVGIVPSLDIHAGLSHVWSDLDDVAAFGFGYEFDKLTSTRGRLGVRGNFGGLYNPYLGATVYREFEGDADLTITNGAFASDLGSRGKGTWARLEGGLGGGSGTYGLNLAGWVDVGDTRGLGIRAGFRF